MQTNQKINNRGFTLFELMVSMSIFALLMISVFDAIANIGIARTKSMSRITLIEELYFFSEKLATSIKDGGIIDYEEYWNRRVVGTDTATGHYTKLTGFGNYGSGGVIGTNTYGSMYYYCRSGTNILVPSDKVGTGGCLEGRNSNSIGNFPDVNYSGTLQRYGQYALQYTDYNGNVDSDTNPSPIGGIGPGDEDGNGDIRYDEDDLDIGDGPITISGSTPELYLYNPLTKERTFFRWTLTDDPGLPAGTCIYSGPNMGSGCLGNIEVLKMRGLDIGLGHSGSLTDSGTFDGNIDTWICHEDWNCSLGVTLNNGVGAGKLPTGSASEWVKMFPEYVSVRQLSFTIYPVKDPWKSWAAPDCITGCTTDFISPFIQPYVRIQMTLGLAWEKRRLIRGDDPSIAISTTISLSHNNIE